MYGLNSNYVCVMSKLGASWMGALAGVCVCMCVRVVCSDHGQTCQCVGGCPPPAQLPSVSQYVHSLLFSFLWDGLDIDERRNKMIIRVVFCSFLILVPSTGPGGANYGYNLNILCIYPQVSPILFF